jgi:hypothetical protein
MKESMEMNIDSQREVELPFEQKDISILRQQIFDLEDEIIQRQEKYETKINYEKNHGDTTASTFINGVETTPELIASLQERLQNMKEVEKVLAQQENAQVVGRVVGFARKAAVVASMVLGSAVAKEGIERKSALVKTKEIPNTEIGIHPESL